MVPISVTAHLWANFKKHWIVAVVVSVSAAVAAIVAFLSGLARVWSVLSHDTVPDFLSERGWTVTSWLSGPPWMTMTVMVVAFGVLMIQVALLKQAYAQRVFETGRVDRETLNRFKKERDDARAEAMETKRQFGLERLRLLGGFTINGQTPTVTIRYVGHGPDYALVERIEQVFQQCCPSWAITIDGTNNPLLRPDARFKVVFESGGSFGLGGIPSAFLGGDLLGVPVGEVSSDRPDPTHVVMRVLPSA